MRETEPDQRIETAALVREFVPLNRRRLQGDPPLDVADLARWNELRDLIEDALGAAPAPAGTRRRRSLRVRAHLKVLVTTHLAQELLHVHDLSENGFFLRTHRPAPVGSSLNIELHDRQGQSVELEGTVIWSRATEDGLGPSGMGVAFHALTDWDRAVLLQLVETALSSLA